MNPQVLGLGVPELLIILAVVLLLFGGSRLAGIGRSSGRAIREFKQETKGLKESEAAENQRKAAGTAPSEPDRVHEAELVDPAPERGPEDYR